MIHISEGKMGYGMIYDVNFFIQIEAPSESDVDDFYRNHLLLIQI